MFDPKKPTVLLLGRWQPWHKGHLALFERALAKTGQVVIQVRDVKDSSGGLDQEDNPFSFEEISKDIAEKLFLSGYKINEDDRNKLRKIKFSELQILEIIEVTSFFNMTNRIASGTNMIPNKEYYN